VSETYLTKDDLMAIPFEKYPMPVLSDSLRSFFSWGIKAHEKGCYSHFMWLFDKGLLASQGLFGFKKVSIGNYLSKYRLKLWECYTLTPSKRWLIRKEILNELGRPWYKNMYDLAAYPCQLLGWHWLQVPGADLCSDKAKYLRLVDPEFTLSHPDPEQVNRWLAEHPDRYRVYGRYTPD